MARVTVEDCIDKVDNRFELILFAAQRSRQINNGADLYIDRDNDKNPVVALRELAEEKLEHAQLTEELIQGMQKQITRNEPTDDDMKSAMKRPDTEEYNAGDTTIFGSRVAEDEQVSDIMADKPMFEDVDEDIVKD